MSGEAMNSGNPDNIDRAAALGLHEHIYVIRETLPVLEELILAYHVDQLGAMT